MRSNRSNGFVGFLFFALLATGANRMLDSIEKGVSMDGAGLNTELPQFAYVWQRNWKPELEKEVLSSETSFDGLTFLAAEFGWKKGLPNLDYLMDPRRFLCEIQGPVTLAIRIQPYSGPFQGRGTAIEGLIHGIRQVTDPFQEHNIPFRGVQVDFDCAAADLGGYRLWINRLKSEFPNREWSITALPNWLNHPECRELFRSVNLVVMQVHSLEKPTSIEQDISLCDVEDAVGTAHKLDTLGIPFLMALPTYSYRLAFDATGKFIGLSAETNWDHYPDDTRFRVVESDPVALSRLIQSWRMKRPSNMKGVIWFRLPVSSDRLNWHPTTLETVIRGEQPMHLAEIRVEPGESGLLDLSLTNKGSLPVRHLSFKVVASQPIDHFDVFEGIKAVQIGSNHLHFSTVPEVYSLNPGSSRPTGWIKLREKGEFTLSIFDEKED